MLKQFTGIALVAGVLAIPFVLVAPASAATLPDGDTLYAISCDDGDEEDADFADLYLVDADTADLTLIGNTTLDDDCAGPAAFDPTDGTPYYLSWGGDESGLAIVNLTTGVATVTPITGDSTSAPDGLAIGLDGVAWIIWSDDLYSVDLVTGVTALVAPLTETCLYSFSVDPTTGKFYVIQCLTGEAFELAVPSGTLTPIGTIDLEAPTYALQIDTSGRWWFEQEFAQEGESSLWSTPIPAGPTEPEFEGDFYDSAAEYYPYSESLLLTYAIAPPAPLLPATGTEIAPVVTTALALATLGGALALVAVRRRRSA